MTIVSTAAGRGLRISVAIVEDNPLHAQRYRQNLARDDRLVLVGDFRSAAEACAALGALAPDVLLVDLGLPDGSGFDVIRQVRHASPQTCIMVVSVFGGERNLFEAIESGATGYLLKDSLPEDFNASIHALQAGGSPISPALARLLLVRLRPQLSAPMAPVAPSVPEPAEESPLSPRESVILGAISRGRSVTEIGEQLRISPLTVKTHVRNIYRKLQARSRQHAVYLAQQRGLLKP
ncbi:response regulator transcription factor [Ramlibacter sp. G-1-2-2]|uniref:Response regulator transcription factor n=1 Tax=Ramlibacter agri TaxID=2728837 RepID=A0A848H858_9BURK|nr:response regulator transcription factor [Ramlibacter agri]NML46132.1 response regulator transcription factor [Ramlibacter agri]